MEKEFITKNIDERNKFITELYQKGIKYSYSRKDNSGDYHVKYEANDRQQ